VESPGTLYSWSWKRPVGCATLTQAAFYVLIHGRTLRAAVASSDLLFVLRCASRKSQVLHTKKNAKKNQIGGHPSH
jgi:hypothetical protein